MRGSKGYCRIYERICRVFEPARRLYFNLVEKTMDYSRVKEAEAAYYASLKGDPYETCRFLYWASSTIRDSNVCVIGPLHKDEDGLPPSCDVVMGVEQVYLSGLRCDIVWGDLDVTRGKIIEENAVERYRMVHVHGDNYERVVEWRDYSGRRTIFTSQAYCLWPVIGIGGFTDGDRLVLLAMGMGAKIIRLIGFDFDHPACVGKGFCNMESKKLKLALAKRLLTEYSFIFKYNIVDNSLQHGILLQSRS